MKSEEYIKAVLTDYESQAQIEEDPIIQGWIEALKWVLGETE